MLTSPFNLRKIKFPFVLALLLFSFTSSNIFAQGQSYHVMEVVELQFNSQRQYDNPYLDVDVWIELRNSRVGKEVYRVPIFWDGGNVFRARLVATSSGNWSWKILNETVQNSDKGFLDQSGSFTAVPADVSRNPNNRGFIRVADNNRTLEYADGTPFFYTADTAWSALTEVFGFDRANSISGISFQDYILARKRQGFNGLNVIASFPDDTYLAELGRNLQRPGTKKGLWASSTWGKKVGPNGATPFEMKSSRQPVTDKLPEVDYKKINPTYWQAVDERMQFLSDQGFVTLFETIRRHERWPFRLQDEKNAFYDYVRYLWARYGCYNMIFSWVHHDNNSGNVYPEWRELVKYANSKLYGKLGAHRMPYGQPRTAMSYNSSLVNWNKDIPSALDIQNVSNSQRDETMHRWLRDIYNNEPAKPGLNLEPYYPGWGFHSGNDINAGLDDTTMAQMQMYGSVLSGGLAGHAWGDAWYAGAGSSTTRANGGTIVPVNDPQKNALNSFESQAMGHLKSFVLDSGHEYHKLIPAAHTNLSDSKDFVHTLSISKDKNFALGFFTADNRSNPTALPYLTNLLPSKKYLFEWWHVTNGGWISEGYITTTSNGKLAPPALPNKNDRSRNWAYRIRSVDYIKDEPENETNDNSEIIDDFALRINTGGGSVTYNGHKYMADNYFDTGRTLHRPQTGLTDPYKTFRYSRSQVMGYDIPIDNGSYTVRLHFAELWFGATDGGSAGAGRRVFDVRLEGQLAENDLDIFAEVGAEALLVKEHQVTVSDGQLNIDFSSLAANGGVRHPVINAIEILGKTSAPQVTTSVSVSPSAISLNIGKNAQLTAAISPEKTDAPDINWTSSNASVAIVDKNGQVTALTEGTTTITATVNGGSAKGSSTVKVTAPSTTSVALRINAGGGSVTYNGNKYMADDYFDTGRTLHRPQTGLTDPYKTFRYSRSQVMGYDIPIDNGSYTVRLHFAELYFGATDGGSAGAGRRVFDVRLEGQLAENDLDIFAEVGAEALLVKEHQITVSDGQLNIDFSSLAANGGVRHPVINAIEILGNTTTTNKSGSLTSKGTVAPSNEDSLQNTASEPYAHPNPTTGRCRISGLTAGEKEIVVVDFIGRVLIAFTTKNEEPELNLSSIPDGIYTVKVKQNELESIFKVIKQ